MQNTNNTDPAPKAREMYGSEYYDRNLGPQAYDQKHAAWRNHFRTMAETIVERYHPKRVLDVGCAKGFLVEHLRNCGVEAFGLDASQYAISQASEAARPYCKVASGGEPFAEKYDLITWIEVAEHVPPRVASQMIQNICAAAGEVIFSSTPSDFNDDTHLNIQPREVWDRAFAERQFYPDLHFDPLFISPQAVHYKTLARPVRVAVFSNEPKSYAVIRLRLLSPIQHLEKQGRLQLIFVSKDDPLLPIEDLLSCDIFIIQREFANKKLSSHIIQCARFLKKPVVFETDDLLHRLPLSNPNHLNCAAIAGDLRDAMAAADFVTVSTERLGEELERDGFIKKEQKHVLTNCIDTDIWGSAPPPPVHLATATAAKTPIVIGWMGTATHDEDLSIIKQAVAYILRRHEGRVVFKTWGYMPEEFRSVPGAILARGAEHNIQKHAADVRASGIDIALAPLTDHVFNHAKSHLKWLEYSICGIPGIYSNVTPYSSNIANNHTGLLVENTSEAWAQAIDRLIENPVLRASIAHNAHRVVRERHSLDARAWRWDFVYRSFVVSGPRPAHAAMPSGHENKFSDNGEVSAIRAAACLFADQTNRLLSKGHAALAIKSFENALSFDPEYASRGVLLGGRLSQQCRDSLAVAVFEASAAANAAQSYQARLALAGHYQSAGDSLQCESVLATMASAPGAAARDIRPYISFLAAAGRLCEAGEALKEFVAAKPEPVEIVTFTNELLAGGFYDSARQLLSDGAAIWPHQSELGDLQRSLEAKIGGPSSVAPDSPKNNQSRVVVFASRGPSHPRGAPRAPGALAELERQRRISLEFTNGRENKHSLARAAVVVVSNSSLRDSARAASLQKWMSGPEFSPETIIITEFDELPADAERAAIVKILESARAVVVPHADWQHEVSACAPFDAGRIFIIPDAVDAASAPRLARAARNGPLQVGYVSNINETNHTKQVLREIADRFASAGRTARLEVFGPVPECLRGHAAVRQASEICDTSREWMRALATERCDMAIIPAGAGRGARREAELQWLQFAMLQIPSIVSSRMALPGSFAHGDNAWLTPESGDAWIEAIAKLAAAHELRNGIAHRAWSQAMNTRTTQQIAPRWTELLNWVRESAPVSCG
ncbi:MAG: glycosyltransferase [Planctomycetes bacterium]|nr:glycosyltransferase [Planctomycetota bacterium]